jgi:hypothetical protein
MKPVRLQVLTTGLLFLLPGLARAAAAPVTVANLNDSGPGSLRQAIADAAAGSTINFSVTGTITLTSGALTIAKDLDIEGPGSDKLTVSGNHASRVFVIQSGTATLAGMTIANGLANGSSPDPICIGGGVVNSANLTLSHDVLSANQALGDPSKGPFGMIGVGTVGGVANFGTLQVTACQFTGNLARGANGTSNGGGIGGALGSWGSASVTASQFAANVARGGDRGGGVEVGGGTGGAIGNAGTLTVSGSTFTDNQAIGGNDNLGSAIAGTATGGAIYTGGGGQAGASLTVSDSRFDHNQAIAGSRNQPGGRAAGGAIEGLAGPVTLSGCMAVHNQAIAGSGAPGVDGGPAWGGGFNVANDYGVGSSGTISNSTVEQNLALGGEAGPGGSGGEGRGGGLGSDDGGTLTVSSTTVRHNLAMGGPGGAGGSGGNGLEARPKSRRLDGEKSRGSLPL